jgi:hypothetical protein
MTNEAYDDYVKKCKAKGITPSSREALINDPLDESTVWTLPPVYIRHSKKPRKKVSNIAQVWGDLSDDTVLTITKGQLIALERKIREEEADRC